jgi:hypothetical protein
VTIAVLPWSENFERSNILNPPVPLSWPGGD